MKPIIIPDSYNYISAFLTFSCNFHCRYCINKFSGLKVYNELSAASWIRGLNRIQTIDDRPITLTGGEPALYREFYSLVNGIDLKINIDLLTNGSFDVHEFMRNIKPDRLMRKSKYASIRFSYHPENTDPDELLVTLLTLANRGYSVGVWAVDTGDPMIQDIKKEFEDHKIDFRLKEYLDHMYGTYKYPKALDGMAKPCSCKPSEMLIAPDGRIFKCHYDLYLGINSYAHILDEKVKLLDDFQTCCNYGLCNPCDIKMKFDRFQREGHCSVTIKETDGNS